MDLTTMPGLKYLRGRNYLTDLDFTRGELEDMLVLAVHLKKLRAEMRLTPFLPGRHLAMIFEASSTRTRVSFETGMTELGGHAVYLRPGEMHLPGRESVADTGRVLSRFLHAIMARTQTVAVLRELADAATVPVINGEAGDWDHPIQSVSDALTILEYGGRLEGETMAWLGHGDCMCNSVLLTASRLGMNVNVVTPAHFPLSDEVRGLVEDNCREHGTRLLVAESPEEVVADADYVYTSLWWWEDSAEYVADVRRKMQPYQVNEALWAKTKPGARFMHCLPAVRGDEVTDAIIDGPASMVWDMAENRKHLQKAVVLALVGIDRLPKDPDLQAIGRALLS
ncbi:MAG: ornithine carbamoyltransferase [Actinomycetes bacterium]